MEPLHGAGSVMIHTLTVGPVSDDMNNSGSSVTIS